MTNQPTPPSLIPQSELDAMRARCDAATPVDQWQATGHFEDEDNGPGTFMVSVCPVPATWKNGHPITPDPIYEDATFTQHARADLPRLLDAYTDLMLAYQRQLEINVKSLTRQLDIMDKVRGGAEAARMVDDLNSALEGVIHLRHIVQATPAEMPLMLDAGKRWFEQWMKREDQNNGKGNGHGEHD